MSEQEPEEGVATGDGPVRKRATGAPGPAPGPSGEPRPRQHRTLKLMEGGEEAPELSPQEARRARAVREHLRAVFDPTPSGVPAWRIEGTSGQSYRILVPAFPSREGASCSCRDFTTRGLGTCKHLEATLAQAASAPPASLSPEAGRSRPTVGWKEIDEAQARVMERLLSPASLSHPQLALALRKVGRRLTATNP